MSVEIEPSAQPAPPAPGIATGNSAGAGRTGDRVAAIVMLIVSAVIALCLAFAGLMLVMSSDSCGSVGPDDCDTGLFTIAWLASMAAPIGGFVATLVFTIARLAKNRSAFWVPIAGTIAFCGGFAAAVALAFHALN